MNVLISIGFNVTENSPASDEKGASFSTSFSVFHGSLSISSIHRSAARAVSLKEVIVNVLKRPCKGGVKHRNFLFIKEPYIKFDCHRF